MAEITARNNKTMAEATARMNKAMSRQMNGCNLVLVKQMELSMLSGVWAKYDAPWLLTVKNKIPNMSF